MKHKIKNISKRDLFIDGFINNIMDFVTKIPKSNEPRSYAPEKRSESIIKSTATKIAFISGSLALPGGIIGLLTILPDLAIIWKLQVQMITDIAYTFGKNELLNKEILVYCLFKHSSQSVVSDLIIRFGQRILIKKVSLKFIYKILRLTGRNIVERFISKNFFRWIPIVGALTIAGVTINDTKNIGLTTLELFINDFTISNLEGTNKKENFINVN